MDEDEIHVCGWLTGRRSGGMQCRMANYNTQGFEE